MPGLGTRWEKGTGYNRLRLASHSATDCTISFTSVETAATASGEDTASRGCSIGLRAKRLAGRIEAASVGAASCPADSEPSPRQRIDVSALVQEWPMSLATRDANF